MGKAAVLAPGAWSRLEALERVPLVRVSEPLPAHWLGLGPLAAVLASDAVVRLERILEPVRQPVWLKEPPPAQRLERLLMGKAAVLAPRAWSLEPVQALERVRLVSLSEPPPAEGMGLGQLSAVKAPGARRLDLLERPLERVSQTVWLTSPPPAQRLGMWPLAAVLARGAMPPLLRVRSVLVSESPAATRLTLRRGIRCAVMASNVKQGTPPNVYQQPDNNVCVLKKISKKICLRSTLLFRFTIFSRYKNYALNFLYL